jgi:hypothetical protein
MIFQMLKKYVLNIIAIGFLSFVFIGIFMFVMQKNEKIQQLSQNLSECRSELTVAKSASSSWRRMLHHSREKAESDYNSSHSSTPSPTPVDSKSVGICNMKLPNEKMKYLESRTYLLPDQKITIWHCIFNFGETIVDEAGNSMLPEINMFSPQQDMYFTFEIADSRDSVQFQGEVYKFCPNTKNFMRACK